MASESPADMERPDDVLDAPSVARWRDKRRETIQGLRELADVLDGNNRKSKMAGLAGSTASVIGATLGIGSVVLSGGMSLLGMAAVTSIGGAATTLSGKLFESKAVKEALAKTQQMIDSDRSAKKEVEDLVNVFKEVEMSILQAVDEGLRETRAGKVPIAGQSPLDDCDERDEEMKLNTYREVAKTSMTALKTGLTVARSAKTVQQSCRLVTYGKAAYSALEKAGRGIGILGKAPVVKTVSTVGRAAKFGAVFSVVLLPLDIADMVRNSDALQNGAIHEVSEEIRQTAEKLELEMNELSDYIRTFVEELVLFLCFLESISTTTSRFPSHQEDLFKVLIRLCEPVKGFTKDFNKLSSRVRGCEIELFSNKGAGLSTMAMQTGGFRGSLLRELSTWLWCSLYLNDFSVMFLLETRFTDDPVLWKAFGDFESVCGTGEAGGVAILLPSNFPGEILEVRKYKDTTYSSFNGRCLSVKIRNDEDEITLVVVCAPDQGPQYAVGFQQANFLTKVEKFLNQSVSDKLVLASNVKPDAVLQRQVVRNGASFNRDGVHLFMSRSLVGVVSRHEVDSTLKVHGISHTAAIRLVKHSK